MGLCEPGCSDVTQLLSRTQHQEKLACKSSYCDLQGANITGIKAVVMEIKSLYQL